MVLNLIDIRANLVTIAMLIKNSQEALRPCGWAFNNDMLSSDLEQLQNDLDTCFSSLYVLEEEVWEKENL